MTSAEKRKALDEYVANAVAIRDLERIQTRLAAVLLGDSEKRATRVPVLFGTTKRATKSKTTRQWTTALAIKALSELRGRVTRKAIDARFADMSESTKGRALRALRASGVAVHLAGGLYEFKPLGETTALGAKGWTPERRARHSQRMKQVWTSKRAA